MGWGESILDVGYCKKLSQPLCLEADRQAAGRPELGEQVILHQPDQQHDKDKDKDQQHDKDKDKEWSYLGWEEDILGNYAILMMLKKYS